MASEHSNRGTKRAREARAALGFTREGPLPDLLEAIEGPGGAHVIVLALAEGVAGAYIAREGCPLLFVNGNQAVARQRFTVAHEFGHHRMGHATVVDRQSAIGSTLGAATEVAANAFAAEFLMPRDAVVGWGREHIHGAVTLEDVCALACSFAVSAHVARYALETAKVLTDTRVCEQLDDEIAEGLHVELSQQLGLELVHDELAETVGRLPRIPTIFRGSAFGDFLAGQIGEDGLAQRMQRDPQDVRAMLEELGLDQLLTAAP